MVLKSIPYIEDEIELELELGSAYTLPEDFDPYTNVVAISAINYMEDEKIELDFNTAKCLPEGFDPYTGSIQ